MNRLSTSFVPGALGLCFALSAIAGCGSAPPPPPEPTPVATPDYFEGHWEGVAEIATDIPDAPEEMDIVAIISDQHAARCGMIEYSAIGCSGTWDCTAGSTGDSLTIREHIRFGVERCPDGATVTLTRTNDPDVMDFRYNGLRIQAHGQVHRRAIQ